MDDKIRTLNSWQPRERGKWLAAKAVRVVETAHHDEAPPADHTWLVMSGGALFDYSDPTYTEALNDETPDCWYLVPLADIASVYQGPSPT